MKILYNVLMSVVAALFPLARWFGGKGKLLAEGQSKFPATVESLARWRKTREKVIWFHCASLGEFEQGRPVLEEFRRQNPDYGVLLTFFSPSGYEVRKNYAQADFICYLPLDTARRSRKFVEAARPDTVVFVKYEFWPNVIREIKRSGARLIGISVILRKEQAFFQPWGDFFRKTLARFDYLFVQNRASADLLDTLGYTRHEVAGDTRFDRVMATARDAAEVPGIRTFLGTSAGDGPLAGDVHNAVETEVPGVISGGREVVPAYPEEGAGRAERGACAVMVAGSVWPEDMAVLKPFMAAHPEMKFIIAPHDIKPEQISGWLSETSGLRYSDIEKYSGENILFIDSIGLLARLYRYADYALVGGGFRTGLHNILEPAVFGIPVFFGDKKYKKFQEALDLLELGVAFTVNSSLEEVVAGLDLPEIHRKAEAYVDRNAGATGMIISYLSSR